MLISFLGTWLRNEICGPLGADVYLAVTDKEADRVRNLSALSKFRAVAHSLLPNNLGADVAYNFLAFSKVLKSFQERFLSNEKRGYDQPFVAVDPGADPADLFSTFLIVRAGGAENHCMAMSTLRHGDWPYWQQPWPMGDSWVAYDCSPPTVGISCTGIR
jgi:hypothetical protein